MGCNIFVNKAVKPLRLVVGQVCHSFNACVDESVFVLDIGKINSVDFGTQIELIDNLNKL